MGCGGVTSVRLLLFVLMTIVVGVTLYDSHLHLEEKSKRQLSVDDVTLLRHNFRHPNQLITEYDADVASRLSTLVARKATADDPELIRLIRDVIDKPPGHMIKMSRSLLKTPQAKEADSLLNKTNGFFVECGALDGERSSNTLFFELERDWTGLLVEMDPYFYTQLLGKNRKAWSINACLSPEPYVTQLPFMESSFGTGRLSDNRNRGKLIPCFPLDALLAALNQTTVDYFSLDVEGYELPILRTIPFDKLDIKVLSVEYIHGKGSKEDYAKFMAQKGYLVHKDISFSIPQQSLYVEDFIFVKK
jgi:hypothetical protein